MSTLEYQTLYDQAFDLTWMDCETFDLYFRQYDDSYMRAMRKLTYRELVKKDKVLSDAEFEANWFNLTQNRGFAVRDITRCYDTGGDGDGGDDTEVELQ